MNNQTVTVISGETGQSANVSQEYLNLVSLRFQLRILSAGMKFGKKGMSISQIQKFLKVKTRNPSEMLVEVQNRINRINGVN